jgi:uncharacterized protein YlxW (UPF0749 family)
MPDSQTSPGRTLPEHVTLPLLEVITRSSLDEDYKHVAEARAAAGTTPSRPKQPRRRAAVVVGLFGLLIVTAAVQTSRNAGTNERTREELISKINERREEQRVLQREISDMRGENAELEGALGAVTRDERSAAARAESLGVVTGFVPVDGPGVRIRLDDSVDGNADGVVRDEDLATLVNGLWSAGAEAISVNGHRITLLSGIRNVSTAIHIKTQPLKPPYVVLAVGDPNTLQARFAETPSGLHFLNLMRSFHFEFVMDNAESLTLPAGNRPELRSAEHVAARPETKEVTP